jgi:hypothetical protein
LETAFGGEPMKLFMLGMMIAYTPTLLVLAYMLWDEAIEPDTAPSR